MAKMLANILHTITLRFTDCRCPKEKGPDKKKGIASTISVVGLGSTRHYYIFPFTLQSESLQFLYQMYLSVLFSFLFHREIHVDHEEIMITKTIKTFLREMEILEISVL